MTVTPAKTFSDPQQQIRVALVITELEVGGAERCLANLATRIDRTEFDVAVISLASRPAPGRDVLVRQLEEEGIGVSFLNCDSKWRLPMAVRRLSRMISAGKPHVVHSFLFHANVATSMALGRRRQAKLIHGLRVAEQGSWRRWLQSYYARQADLTLVVSRKLKEFARDVLQVRSLVTPNGIDLAEFDEQTAQDVGLKQVDGRKRMIAVGRLDPQKGFDWLLDTLRDALLSSDDWELQIVGAGPQESALKDQARKLHLIDRVQFLGRRADVPQLLTDADLFLLSSRWEGMPNALIEAMAARLPVVATDVEGVAQLLGPLQQTQLSAAGDAEGFAERVAALAADPELRVELGEANRARIESHFTLDKMVNRHAKIYRCAARSLDEMLASPPKRR
ncbi:putative teichuronic acid biosynthesis glycosyltransferase TuaC [Blastopirellula retiformator]|uniref:Putative teichuronic acid biosynthesis glycosyltransferase TuaC n=1 Tax=Blastopirellula retiformator TaxID=2527970 RepID=A0A5C5VBG6_9BACT|nr:putative teichuronic acid biosynthesis glycosyltransferase TuaC [Blastopirellula retiformator]